jgi:hypothetical protein
MELRKSKKKNIGPVGTRPYDPTTSSIFKNRRNAWMSGPPLELFFEPGRSSQDDADFPPLAGHGVAQDDYSTSGSGGGYGTPSAHSFGGQSSAGKSGKSSITHETEPTSEITQTMEELVQAAVAASTAKLAKDFQELRAENAKIKADFLALQTSIAALPAQLLDGTLVALRSPSSPMYEMQQMMMAFMQKVEVSLTELRMEASRSSDPAKLSSPPRKVSRSDPSSADSPMALSAEGGVGYS